MTDAQKVKIINEILAKMDAIWKRSHRYLTENDFEEMLKVYDSLCEKRGSTYAGTVWKRDYKLPTDFKFKPDMPITAEAWVQLNPDISRKWKNPNLDVHFALTADEIIDRRVPGRVCTCGGVAKVFCKYAIEAGLDCVEVQTVNVVDMKTGELDGGHQIMAVELGGKLVAFDPGDKVFKPLDEQAEIKVGNWIQSVRSADEKYLIINIVSPQQHLNVKCHRDEFNPTAIENALRIAQKNKLESGRKKIIAEAQQALAKRSQGNENE